MNKSIKKAVSALLALTMCAAGTGLLPVIAEDADTKTIEALPLGTYEVETFEGATVWTSIYENQLPNYSGEGFAYLTASPIYFNVEVEEEGMYEIKFRAAQILGAGESRMQTISINGIDYSYNMPYLTEWTDVSFGVFRLKAGVNELALKPIYGYAAYDTITIEKAVFPELKGTGETSDPNATPEAKSLLKYLNSVYGEHILSGQQEIYGGGHGVQTSIRYDASSDTCVDGDGKTYEIDKESYDTDEQGNKFPWHCMDETGFVYTYSTQNHNYTYNDYDQECRYLYELTGHYPAIRGFDFNCHNPGFAWEDGVTERMIDWTKNKNGICTASWHVTVPTSMDDFEVDEDGNITKISNDWQKFTYGISTDFVTANCMVEGTKEYYFFREAMRLLAEQFQILQDAGVPVLFRPLHEAEGNPGQTAGDGKGAWFWWSKEGTEVYHQLWKLLYTTLTEEYGLHNIIWEQNLYAWSEDSALWYTGDEWVDIVGFDKYNTTYNRHDGKSSGTPNEDAESKIFWSQVGYVDNKKMVSMPENDSIPSLENMEIENAKWLYFCTWYDGEAGAPQFISGAEYQNPETLKTLFNSDFCITLDELPADLFSGSGDVTTPTEKTTETEGDFKYGDVDASGDVDILDVITLNKALLGKEKISETQQKAADVNLSGKPDSTDSLIIMKHIVGLVTELPVKE
ncbi:MAG: beta-mannosidase [Oscillospiraceae bacterium]|nr:beta-mannosidase [Oscillospiraceae bacterium]